MGGSIIGRVLVLQAQILNLVYNICVRALVIYSVDSLSQFFTQPF